MFTAIYQLNWRKVLLRSAIGCLFIFVMLIWASRSETAVRWLADEIQVRSGGELSLMNISGSLYGPLKIGKLHYETTSVGVSAENIQIDWPLWKMLFQHQVELSLFQAETINVKIGQLSAEPLPLPDSLRFPLSLQIPAARIDRLIVDTGSKQVEFSEASFSLASTESAHQLIWSGYSSELGKADVDINLAQDKPFELSGELMLSRGDAKDINVRMLARGTLAQFAIDISGAIPSAKLSGTVVAQPLEVNVVRAVDMEVDDFNPVQWNSDWPIAKIDLSIHAQSDSAGALAGTVAFKNSLPGSINQHRLPVTELMTRLAGTLATPILSDLRIKLHEGGQVNGQAQLGSDHASAKLIVAALNLQGIHSKLAKTQLHGKLNLSTGEGGNTLSGDLTQRGYQIHLRARQSGDEIFVDQALVQAGQGELILNGDMSMLDKGNFQLKGKLKRFDPSAFGAFPTASINANLEASGNLFGQRRIQAEFGLAGSRWAGQALQGSAHMAMQNERLSKVDVALKLAENQLAVAGSLGAKGDKLSIRLDAPRLADFGFGLAGVAHVQGTIEGDYSDPSGTIKASLAGFSWKDYQLAQGQLSARISAGADGPVSIAANITESHLGDLGLSHASIELAGTRGRHQATFTAKGKKLDLHAALTGGWHALTGWEGRLEQMENTGAYPFELRQPALFSAGTKRLSIQQAHLRALRGELRVNEISYQQGKLVTRGEFSGVAARDMQQMLGVYPSMDISLNLGGTWDLSIGSEVDGAVSVRRESGDILMLDEPVTALGMSGLILQLNAKHNFVDMHLDAKGARLGTISAKGETRVSRRDGSWGVDGYAPVRGDADISVQSLAWLAPLISPALVSDGTLNMKLSIKGAVNAPLLDGVLTGDELLLELPEQGVYLKHGVLRGVWSGGSMKIHELSFNSGAGRLSATGEASLQDGMPRTQLRLVADKAELITRPDRRLTLSGVTTVTVKAAQLRVEGNLQVIRGMIQLPKTDAPTLSDDVVIIGDESAVSTKTRRVRPEVDLGIDLGQEFFLKGRGLDAQLAGAIRLRSSGNDLPQANGSIRVEKGEYFAYGQRLTIDRGVLNFSGPLDNPGLNILAMRKMPAVEVGVSISGTALAPQVKLVSSQPMSDSEKMSWLILGHGLESANQSELGVMSAAASALLDTGESLTLQSKIAHAAGLDEFSVNSTGDVASTAVTLGKKLSSRAYLSYEQSVVGISNLVKVNYMLSKGWSVRAQSGTDSAVDVFYTLTFE